MCCLWFVYDCACFVYMCVVCDLLCDGVWHVFVCMFVCVLLCTCVAFNVSVCGLLASHCVLSYDAPLFVLFHVCCVCCIRVKCL